MTGKYDRQGKPMGLMEWARAFEADDRHVGDDRIGEAHVSTVWLGLDHSFGEGPPLIFETMIFGGPHEEYCERYSTEEEARAGHERIVAALREGRSLEGEGHE